MQPPPSTPLGGLRELLASRRHFLRLALTFAGASALGPPAAASTVPGTETAAWEADTLRLNPAFSLRLAGEDRIDLLTRRPDGSTLKHTFGGLPAEVLRGAADSLTGREVTDVIAGRRGSNPARYRDGVRRAVAQLERARLVYRGERMLVKIVEVGR